MIEGKAEVEFAAEFELGPGEAQFGFEAELELEPVQTYSTVNR